MLTTPLSPVVWPYTRRVTVQRSVNGMYAFLLSLHGWTPGTDLREVARTILTSGDASPAGARVSASTDTVLWIDVEPDDWTGHAVPGVCSGECDRHGV